MNSMKRISVMALSAMGVAWASSLVIAQPALVEIAPVDGSTVTQGRAITPDAKYVVGSGDPASVGDPGFIWDAVNGSRAVIADGAQAHELVGVDYRTFNGNKEIVAFGTSTAGPYPTYYIFLEADAAAGLANWGLKLRRTGDVRSFPVSNGLVASSLQADAWFDTFTKAINQAPTGDTFLIVEQGSGAPLTDLTNILQDQKNVPVPNEAKLQAVSSTGLAVGWRKVNNVARNYVSQFTGTGGLSGNYWPNGLRAAPNNREGQLWAIAASSTATDNRAGGFSPADGRTGLWPFIVDDFTGSDTGTPTELPTFDANASFATNGIVYGLSADGRYAVGMDFTLGFELAVLWDTELGVELNLTQYAIDNGIIGDFGGNLRRAYAVAVNDSGEIVVTGWGFNDVEAAVRGFVVIVPDIIDALPCNIPFADTDGDTDVDQTDFAAFQKCLTAAGQPIQPDCACFDRDDAALTGEPDGSVTPDDFADFLNCATGPDVPFDPDNPPANCNPGNGALP